MNKRYIYTFLGSFVIAMIVLMGIFYGVGLFASPDDGIEIPTVVVEPTTDVAESTTADDTSGDNEEEEEAPIVNILAFGLNDSLADTIVLFSYNYEKNTLNALTIPRDTHFEVDEHYETWEKKVNSIYGYRGDGGVLGMKTHISRLLGVPIDYYVKVEFNSVIAVVDTLGGYDVNVPYNMDYDDEWANPELHIHIPAGQQHLDGLNTLKFLRFRKNNDGTIQEGDVQRTDRQKLFIKSMINKALDSDIVPVLTTIIKGEYIATDMPLDEVLKYASMISNIDQSKIMFYTLEGEAGFEDGLSFWFHDEDKKKALMRMFYE